MSIFRRILIVFLLLILTACAPEEPEATQVPIGRVTDTAVPTTTSPTHTPVSTNTNPTTIEPEAPQFFDDFENGFNPSWQAISGEWFINNQGQATPTETCGVMVVGNPTWNHFALDLDFFIPEGSLLRLLFNYQEASATELWLTSLESGRTPIVWWDRTSQRRSQIPNGQIYSSYNPDTPHHLTVEIQDQSVLVKLDDEEIFDKNFPTRNHLPGKVGIDACDTGSPLWIDNFSASSLSATETADSTSTPTTQPIQATNNPPTPEYPTPLSLSAVSEEWLYYDFPDIGVSLSMPSDWEMLRYPGGYFFAPINTLPVQLTIALKANTPTELQAMTEALTAELQDLTPFEFYTTTMTISGIESTAFWNMSPASCVDIYVPAHNIVRQINFFSTFCNEAQDQLNEVGQWILDSIALYPPT